MTRFERVGTMILSGIVAALILAHAFRIGFVACAQELLSRSLGRIWTWLPLPRVLALLTGAGAMIITVASRRRPLRLLGFAAGYYLLFSAFFPVDVGVASWDAALVILVAGLSVLMGILQLAKFQRMQAGHCR
jgi:hypothetical protein